MHDEGQSRRNDDAFGTETHTRWASRLDRHRFGSPEYRDEWYAEQCGGCRFLIPLSGVLGDDWGACTNGASPRDGRLQFEHDGCAAFAPVPDDEWGRAPS